MDNRGSSICGAESSPRTGRRRGPPGLESDTGASEGEMSPFPVPPTGSELRLVLLGGRRSGKSSAGNAILGEEAFPTGGRTAACGWSRGEVGGRRVAVADTPGWWCDVSATDTPELVKREMVWRAAGLCAPGPHAFLLAVKASSPFAEKRRRAVEEHLELFGGRVWEHTLVLFTGADGPGDVRRHVETQGRALRWLVEKCGNRYHVLDSTSPATAAQATALLAKLDEMVAGNGGRHYALDGEALREAEERRKAAEGRAKERMADVQKQRSLLRGAARRLPELRIVLLGARQSGKSSAGNRILGRREFPVGGRTASCAVGRGRAAGRRVTVVDTPGWWTNYLARETAEYDRWEVRRGVALCPPGPHAVLVAVRADRAFRETHRRALAEHLELPAGGAVWRHAAVLFTFGDWLAGESAEGHVEAEGGALRWLVEACGNRYHVLRGGDGGGGSGDGAQVARLLERIEEAAAGSGGWRYEPGGSLQEMEEERKAVEERAKERMSKVQEERRAIRSLLPGGVPTLSELTVVLLGCASVGKSSAGNTILGREEFEVGQKTARWRKGEGRVCGRSVAVVDTPGWRAGGRRGAQAGGREAWASRPLRALRPNALLLVVNASSAFPEADRRAAEEGMELLGEGAWGRAAVLFTNGDWLGHTTTVEQRIESEGGALRWLVDRCGNRYHVLSNKRGDETQVAELLEKIEEMEAGLREGAREQGSEEEVEAGRREGAREQGSEEEEVEAGRREGGREQGSEEEMEAGRREGAREQGSEEEVEAGRREGTREQGSEEEVEEEEERMTELREQRQEEELDKDVLLPVCSFSGHHRCVTKRGISGKPFEKGDSFKLHIVPLLSLVLESVSRAGNGDGESSVAGVGSQTHESGGPSLLIDRDASSNAGGQLVKADVLYPCSTSKPQSLFLVIPADQLTALGWRTLGRAGGVLGKKWAEHAAILSAGAEAPGEGGAEEPVQSGDGDAPETRGGDSTIEELESFIDAYAETVKSSSSQSPTRDEGGQTGLDYRSHTSYIHGKLETMQKSLAEMDQTLQLSCQIIQELRGNGREAQLMVENQESQ